MLSTLPKATLGGGCFWCVEAVFQRLKGIKCVESGYAGGDVINPTYEEVKKGNTGHAEVIQLTYDPDEISYADIIKVFFLTHDPTTLNKQGIDVGHQYRSVIFYHDEDQKLIAEDIKKQLDESKYYKDPIVTEITKISNYSKAEDYHQNFFNNNPDHPECKLIIQKKIDKFFELFKDQAQPPTGMI